MAKNHYLLFLLCYQNMFHDEYFEMLYQHCQGWIELLESFISCCCANFSKFSCREHFKQKPFSQCQQFVARCQHFVLLSASSSICLSALARFADAQLQNQTTINTSREPIKLPILSSMKTVGGVEKVHIESCHLRSVSRRPCQMHFQG